MNIKKRFSIRNLLVSAAAVCCTVAMVPAAAVGAAYATGRYTVACQSANVRETPGEGIVGYVANGSSFTVTEVSGSWGYATDIPGTNGKKLSGWVKLDNCGTGETTPAQNVEVSAVKDFSVGDQLKISAEVAVNLRSEADGTSDVIAWVPAGTVVTAKEISGKWINTDYNGKNGWISNENCALFASSASGGNSSNAPSEEAEDTTEPSTAPETPVQGKICINAENAANLRSGADKGADVIGWIKRDTVLNVNSESGEWYCVNYDGKTGWVHKNNCIAYDKIDASEEEANSSVETENVFAGSMVNEKYSISAVVAVNFRSEPTTSSETIGWIKSGTIVTATELKNGWLKISYDGKEGWVYAENCRKYTADIVSDSSDSKEETSSDPETNAAPVETKVNVKLQIKVSSANIRDKAGTSGEVINWLQKGAVVQATAKSGNWYQVKVNGKTGWISGNCVKLADDDDKIDVNPVKIKLNLQKSISYAHKYAHTRNPQYTNFVGDLGTNCCNYVSQILVAGGMPTSKEFRNFSDAFIKVRKFIVYIPETYGVQLIRNPKVSDIEPGDVLITDNYTHVMFAMSVENGAIMANGNDYNRDMLNLPINAVCGVIKTSDLYE